MQEEAQVTHPMIDQLAQIAELADRFKQFTKESAEGALGMAETVVKARALNVTAFEAFCSQIGYPSKSSALRKLAVIGGRLDALRKHADRLPPCWTTIYSLAQLAPDHFDALVPDLKSSMTGGQINARIAKLTGKVLLSDFRRRKADGGVE